MSEIGIEQLVVLGGQGALAAFDRHDGRKAPKAEASEFAVTPGERRDADEPGRGCGRRGKRRHGNLKARCRTPILTTTPRRHRSPR